MKKGDWIKTQNGDTYEVKGSSQPIGTNLEIRFGEWVRSDQVEKLPTLSDSGCIIDDHMIKSFTLADLHERGCPGDLFKEVISWMAGSPAQGRWDMGLGCSVKRIKWLNVGFPWLKSVGLAVRIPKKTPLEPGMKIKCNEFGDDRVCVCEDGRLLRISNGRYLTAGNTNFITPHTLEVLAEKFSWTGWEIPQG